MSYYLPPGKKPPRGGFPDDTRFGEVPPKKPPYKPGSLGTTWKGKDKAQVQAERTAKQSARHDARQAPPAQPMPPAGVPGMPPVQFDDPNMAMPPWVDWLPGGGGYVDPLPGGYQPFPLPRPTGPGGGAQDPTIGTADYKGFHTLVGFMGPSAAYLNEAQNAGYAGGNAPPGWVSPSGLQDPRGNAADLAWKQEQQRWRDDVSQAPNGRDAQGNPLPVADWYGNLHPPGEQGQWGGAGQQGGDMQGMEQMLMALLSGGQMPAGGPPPGMGMSMPGGPQGGPDMSAMLGGMQGMQMPGGMGGYGGPGGIGGGGIDDPIQNYLSTVPVMDQMMRDRVSGAMGQAGLTGSRFSSGAQNTAAKIGGETALQQNQMLNDMLYRHTQSDLDRGLQASMGALGFGAQDLDRGLQAGMGLGQLGMGMDQSQQNRLNALGQVGQWEQGRQDQFSMQRYLDFIQGRKGWLPELFGLAGSASGSPGQPQGYPTTLNSGQPGLIEFLPLLLGLFE